MNNASEKLAIIQFGSNTFLFIVISYNFCINLIFFNYLNEEMCLFDCLVQHETKHLHEIISWKNTTYFKSKTTNQPTNHA